MRFTLPVLPVVHFPVSYHDNWKNNTNGHITSRTRNNPIPHPRSSDINQCYTQHSHRDGDVDIKIDIERKWVSVNYNIVRNKKALCGFFKCTQKDGK